MCGAEDKLRSSPSTLFWRRSLGIDTAAQCIHQASHLRHPSHHRGAGIADVCRCSQLDMNPKILTLAEQALSLPVTSRSPHPTPRLFKTESHAPRSGFKLVMEPRTTWTSDLPHSSHIPLLSAGRTSQHQCQKSRVGPPNFRREGELGTWTLGS